MEKPPSTTPKIDSLAARTAALREAAEELRAATARTATEIDKPEVREALRRRFQYIQEQRVIKEIFRLRSEKLHALRHAATHAPDAELSEAPQPGPEVKSLGRATITITTHAQGTLTAAPAPEAPQVPKLGEKILCFVCTIEQLETAVGHLEEEFRKQASRYNVAHARRLYWWRVACFAGSFTEQAAVRLLARIALLRALLEKVGWL